VRIRGFKLGGKVFETRIESSPGDVVLGGEVPEEGSAADACRLCNLVDSGGIESLLSKQTERRGLDVGMRSREGSPARDHRDLHHDHLIDESLETLVLWL
jgi:hypothetical protein